MSVTARFFGGIILEKVRFKFYFGLVMFTSTVVSLTFFYVAEYEYIFLILLGLSYFVHGSIFVVMPIYYGKMFGPEIGSQAYALFFTSNSIATLCFSAVVRGY